ncbi:hypothetical protein G4228_015118 [Cervus hanglu yarkandensis]|nr:hypothetical protein G4228_015118 [Cervus hanglu yarkandensis]
MAAGPLGSEDLLSAWNRLVWGLTCRALRTCRGGNVRVLQLMLKPWCISRAVYQVSVSQSKEEENQKGAAQLCPSYEGNRDSSCRVAVYGVLIAVASLVANGLSCLVVCDLPGPRIEPMSLHWQVNS